MKKYILTIALVVLMGDPMTRGSFQAPTGEIVWWNRMGMSLGVMDSNGQCIWNEGEPRPCTFKEFSIMLSSFNN